MAIDHDQLVPAWIIDETPAVAWEKLQVVGLRETTSTNEEALQRARQGAASGTLVFAESQTAGRGRKGRQWISPPGTGLYFSLVLRPERSPSCWTLLTHVAAVALARALQELTEAHFIPKPLDVELKWPNDVLISGKKTAGILLETVGIGGAISAAVVGVGVNVRQGGFPAELRDQVISVSEAAGVQVPRRHILVRFLYHFQLGYDLFMRGEHKAILEQWKSLSRMWRDTPVWVVENDQARPAVTAGLTDTGALVVRTPDGAEETILAADVSIRRSPREER
ncbi:MAG: biotin--[acetyl-CoA-carboxylase] ligase [Acidobacteriia bacterium]|nr:biotin--[acetyl-CoA-carboxylase] ligase [Terriglobia bacterium]